jgi:hypothetical protein
VLFTKYYYDDQIKEENMGKAYNAHGEVRNAYKILVEKREDIDVDGRIILK